MTDYTEYFQIIESVEASALHFLMCWCAAVIIYSDIIQSPHSIVFQIPNHIC